MSEETYVLHSESDFLRDFNNWSTLTLEDRLSLLSAYVTNWHGPPKNKAAAESLQLPSSLPTPLYWLYEAIAARHDTPFKPNYGGWTNGDPLVIYHWIKRPSELVIDSHGVIEFLNETQAVYQCGALADAKDPRVLIRQAGSADWKQQADALSDFLLFTIIEEQTMQGPVTASGQFSSEQFNTFVADLLRVPMGNVLWRGAHRASVHLGDGFAIVAGANSNGTMGACAAAKGHAAVAIQELAEWEFFDDHVT